jgi:hypothetical protein
MKKARIEKLILLIPMNFADKDTKSKSIKHKNGEK